MLPAGDGIAVKAPAMGAPVATLRFGATVPLAVSSDREAVLRLAD